MPFRNATQLVQWRDTANCPAPSAELSFGKLLAAVALRRESRLHIALTAGLFEASRTGGSCPLT
jgi:hypothetical protein